MLSLTAVLSAVIAGKAEHDRSTMPSTRSPNPEIGMIHNQAYPALTDGCPLSSRRWQSRAGGTRSTARGGRSPPRQTPGCRATRRRARGCAAALCAARLPRAARRRQTPAARLPACGAPGEAHQRCQDAEARAVWSCVPARSGRHGSRRGTSNVGERRGAARCTRHAPRWRVPRDARHAPQTCSRTGAHLLCAAARRASPASASSCCAATAEPTLSGPSPRSTSAMRGTSRLPAKTWLLPSRKRNLAPVRTAWGMVPPLPHPHPPSADTTHHTLGDELPHSQGARWELTSAADVTSACCRTAAQCAPPPAPPPPPPTARRPNGKDSVLDCLLTRAGCVHSRQQRPGLRQEGHTAGCARWARAGDGLPAERCR